MLADFNVAGGDRLRLGKHRNLDFHLGQLLGRHGREPRVVPPGAGRRLHDGLTHRKGSTGQAHAPAQPTPVIQGHECAGWLHQAAGGRRQLRDSVVQDDFGQSRSRQQQQPAPLVARE
jgi:hypothetical protein